MYQALYRKYRPKNFDELIGQEVIVKTLKNAIEKNKISHAYLFTGPRGTGKTSAAKIFAKTINCKNLINNIPCEKCDCCEQFNNNQNIDIIEIDAASNNGVDEIRELKNKVNLVPSISKYKVYIIDEVHMLSTSAFNALLKTLEEPPSHVIFILATTDPHKVLTTILSRCQRFDFKKVSELKIYERLEYIAEKEKIDIDASALKEISRLANGGLRDALSIFDQVIAYSTDKITEKDVHEVNGTLTQKDLNQIISQLTNQSLSEIICIIDEYDNNGKNFLKLTEELILFYKNILLLKKIPNYFEEKTKNIYNQYVDLYTEEKLIEILNELTISLNNIKNSNNSRLIFELVIIKLINIITNEQSKIKIIDETINNHSIRNEKINKEVEKKEDKKILSENEIITNKEQNEKILQLQDLRINNALARLNKKEIISFKEKSKELNKKILDPDCCEYVSMILDGELKAASDEYLVFVLKTQNIAIAFNNAIPNLENFLNSEFNTNYKIIGVDQQKWDSIKEEFNKKTKKYEYIEEKINLKEIFSSLDNEKNKTSIDSMFENIVEYK